jgi:hypothetical protein
LSSGPLPRLIRPVAGDAAAGSASVNSADAPDGRAPSKPSGGQSTSVLGVLMVLLMFMQWRSKFGDFTSVWSPLTKLSDLSNFGS